MDPAPPHVTLTVLAPDDSIAVTLYGLVRAGAERRPSLARGIRGTVVFAFDEGFVPVAVRFRGDDIEVGDLIDPDRAVDLTIRGRLPDVAALVATPLAGGLPKPTHPRGRAALARLADGRVDFDGPLGLGRKLLRLLAVDPVGPAARPVPHGHAARGRASRGRR